MPGGSTAKTKSMRQERAWCPSKTEYPTRLESEVTDMEKGQVSIKVGNVSILF